MLTRLRLAQAAVVSLLIALAACSSDSSDGSGSGSHDATACSKYTEVGCGTAADCTNQLADWRAAGVAFGKSADAEELIACAAQHGFACASSGGVTVEGVAPPCDVQAAALEGNCGGFFGVGMCDFQCTTAEQTFEVDCGSNGPAYTCHCTTGPNAGTTFEAQTCSIASFRLPCAISGTPPTNP